MSERKFNIGDQVIEIRDLEDRIVTDRR